MTDEDYDALSQRHLASIKHDMRVSLEVAAVHAMHKVLAEFEAPPQRQWVGLTGDEIKATWSQLYCDINKMNLAPDDRPQKETVGFIFAKAVEAKLKEKNT